MNIHFSHFSSTYILGGEERKALIWSQKCWALHNNLSFAIIIFSQVFSFQSEKFTLFLAIPLRRQNDSYYFFIINMQAFRKSVYYWQQAPLQFILAMACKLTAGSSAHENFWRDFYWFQWTFVQAWCAFDIWDWGQGHWWNSPDQTCGHSSEGAVQRKAMLSFYVCAYGSACPLLKSNLTLTFKNQNITGKKQIPASPSLSHKWNICLRTVDSSLGQCKVPVFNQYLKVYMENCQV